jgi:DNA-binding IclR family transcriptional regulator
MNHMSRSESDWFFFTNHFHVLLYVARNPDAQVRIVADEVGLTERAAHRILTDLARDGYITVTKNGRRNHYRVNPGTTLRHRANQEVPLEPLLAIVNPRAKDIHPPT